MTETTERNTAAPPSRATSRSARLSLAIACGAAFLAFLDLSVVNIAFPAIARDFTSVTTTTLTWVVSGYAVAFAALLTPAGRIADALGRRRVFLWALAGFALTSVLCALAPDPDLLIAARFLQGATAALMIPAGLGLVLTVTAPERIGASIAAWTAAGGFAAAVGPAIGGALVEWFGWRSVFVVNAPVALLLLALCLTTPADRPPVGERGLPDWLGTAATALGIGAIVAAVTEGQQWHWDSWRTITVGVIGMLLLGFALQRSRRHPNPAIAVGLWRHRGYALTNLSSFVFGAAMFAWLLAGPLWLAEIWHYSVLESAGALTVGAVASMVTAVIAGRMPVTGQRAVAVVGALMFAGAALYMSTDVFGHDPALWAGWIPAGVLGGGGIGLIVTSLGAAAARALPPQQFATGVGMNVTARQTGGALGVAVLATVLASDAGDSLTAFHTAFAVSAGIAAVAAVTAAIPHRAKELR